VLGRTGVLRGSSGCLNTGSCSFHLVAARKDRVARWCKGVLLFSVIQVGACVTGSWCWNTQGVGASFYWVLEKPESWCLYKWK
jgi:hypothetical protein